MGLMKYLRAQWDRALGIGLMLAGGLAVVLGWVGVSASVYPAEQLPFIISGGIGGLVLLGAGATFWLSADLRDEWRHLDGLEERVEARLAARLGAPELVVDDVVNTNGEVAVTEEMSVS